MKKSTKAATAQAEEREAVCIPEIIMGRGYFSIIGQTPMIMNRLSEKARRELLLPAPKKNLAERATSLKHDPVEEYRASVYMTREPDQPTRLVMPAGAFKKALASAALDIPGATKSQMGRLTSIGTSNIGIYGVPQIHSTIVRQAGMNRTPDVRTRAIIWPWCAYVDVVYVALLISEKQVGNLLAAAGQIIGIGDWRSEKGAGNFGSFRLANAHDPDVEDIVKNGGTEQQDAALANPVAFDADTEELLAWFDVEVARREKVVPSSEKKKIKGTLVEATTLAAYNAGNGQVVEEAV